MGKRKSEKDEEKIRRKIRRLERKLHRSERDSISSSPVRKSPVSNGSHRLTEEHPDSPIDIQSDLEDILLENSTPDAPAILTTATQAACEEGSIPADILNLLGEAKKSEIKLGNKIPEELSKLWGGILTDGLDKEQREMLIKKMLLPENFQMLLAPKLNLEVSAVITEAAKNRDKRLGKAQNQLGTGLAGLSKLTSSVISSDSIDKMDIIKQISEVSQVLLDLHYYETMNRRKLIIPLLDKTFLQVVNNVKRDTYIFGEKLGDNIKYTKEIEKSSKQIKKAAPPAPIQKRGIFTQGNAQGPPRLPGATHKFRQAAAAAPMSRTTSAQRYKPSPANQHKGQSNRGWNRQ